MHDKTTRFLSEDEAGGRIYERVSLNIKGNHKT